MWLCIQQTKAGEHQVQGQPGLYNKASLACIIRTCLKNKQQNKNNQIKMHESQEYSLKKISKQDGSLTPQNDDQVRIWVSWHTKVLRGLGRKEREEREG